VGVPPLLQKAKTFNVCAFGGGGGPGAGGGSGGGVRGR